MDVVGAEAWMEGMGTDGSGGVIRVVDGEADVEEGGEGGGEREGGTGGDGEKGGVVRCEKCGGLGETCSEDREETGQSNVEKL